MASAAFLIVLSWYVQQDYSLGRYAFPDNKSTRDIWPRHGSAEPRHHRRRRRKKHPKDHKSSEISKTHSAPISTTPTLNDLWRLREKPTNRLMAMWTGQVETHNAYQCVAKFDLEGCLHLGAIRCKRCIGKIDWLGEKILKKDCIRYIGGVCDTLSANCEDGTSIQSQQCKVRGQCCVQFTGAKTDRVEEFQLKTAAVALAIGKPLQQILHHLQRDWLSSTCVQCAVAHAAHLVDIRVMHVPTIAPTFAPSRSPSPWPSFAPSPQPTSVPTVFMYPSDVPTTVPTPSPSYSPTTTPTPAPTPPPTILPACLQLMRQTCDIDKLQLTRKKCMECVNSQRMTHKLVKHERGWCMRTNGDLDPLEAQREAAQWTIAFKKLCPLRCITVVRGGRIRKNCQ